MRVLCLVDGRVVPPDRWIWNYLSGDAQRDTVDFLNVTVPDLFPKWGKLLFYYPAYWTLAWKAFLQSRRVDYDLAVAWESKNGFPLAVLRWLLRVRKPKLVILAFSYKGIVTYFSRLGPLVMNHVDHVTVLSAGETEYYRKLLDIPLAKITYSQLGWYDRFSHLATADAHLGDYVFASGRSYRDYRTLFEAAAGVDAQFIVNARKFNVQGLSCPPNIKLNDFMPIPEFTKLMAEARFIVMPLQDTPHAAGEGHIVQAMSAGKALIATRTASTVDYVEDGQTGILVKPYDAQEMRSAITYLLNHPDEAKAMGRRARQRYEEKYTFGVFAKQTYSVLQKVAMSRQYGEVCPSVHS